MCLVNTFLTPCVSVFTIYVSYAIRYAASFIDISLKSKLH